MSASLAVRSIAAPRVRTRVRVHRPSARAAIALLSFAVYLAAAWYLVLDVHSIIGDAWSRVGNAYYVLASRDPHLAAIGFVWNPLPSLVLLPLLPFKGVWPALVSTGFAASIVSAASMAGAVWQLDGIAADWHVGRLPRAFIVLAFAFNPMILYYGANGMSEAMFILALLVTARYLARWALGGGVAPLAVAGVGLAAAYMTRYEAAAAAAGAALAVILVEMLRGTGTLVQHDRIAAFIDRPITRKAATFGAIGVASTVAYVVLYALLREVASAALANAVALVLTALGNTAANRRLTFKVRGRSGLGRHHAAGLLALGVALAITTVSLAALAAVAPQASRAVEIVVLVAANVAATIVRFFILRGAIEEPAGDPDWRSDAAPRWRATADDRAHRAVADLLVFILPFGIAFVGWAAASWLIVGDPFQQFSSEYGVATQLSVVQSAVAQITGQGTATGYVYMLRQIVALQPGILLVALFAAVMGLGGEERRRAMILPTVGVIGAVAAFSVLGFATERTLGWLRYFIALIPLGAVLALAIASPSERQAGREPEPERETPRGAVRGVVRRTVLDGPGAAASTRRSFARLLRPAYLHGLAAGVAVLVFVAALPANGIAMLDPTFNPQYGGEAFQLAPFLAHAAEGKYTPTAQFQVGHMGAAYLDGLHLGSGTVLVDAAMGFPFVLESSNPRQFIITPDRDFKQALGDPTAFGVRYLLVPQPVGYQSLDAINRAYPGIYENGTPFTHVVREFAAGGNDWRLLAVTGQ